MATDTPARLVGALSPSSPELALLRCGSYVVLCSIV
jgi:hypothetical protein